MTFLTRLFESVRCSKNDIRVGLRFAEQSLDQSRRGRSSGFSTGTDDNDIEHLDNGEADISTGNFYSCFVR